MIKFLVLCSLTVHAIVAKPVQQQSDATSHIVIVTPQAQVHLEPPPGAAYIHHLSPLARIAAPHEETVVYVPASAAASIIPVEAVSAERSGVDGQPLKSGQPEVKQSEQLAQQIQQIQQAIQQGSSMLGSQLAEAASAAAAAASSAGQGFAPILFPPTPPRAEDKVKIEKLEQETPVATATRTFVTTEPRRFYAIAPAVPHVVDFVQGPIFISPAISTIRARSFQGEETPIIAVPLPEPKKPEALPLKADLEPEGKTTISQPEKKGDFKRFLEANAVKEDEKEDKSKEKKEDRKEIPKPDHHLDQPQLKTIPVSVVSDVDEPQTKVA